MTRLEVRVPKQTCPFCAEPIEEGLERCPLCGESLLKGAPCKYHPDAVVTGACPDCGTYVCASCRDPQTLICTHCSGHVDATKHYDLGEIVGLVFKDPEWVNHVLIGAGCLLGSFLFFPIFALLGYRLRIIRQQRQQPDMDTLPSWDGFGDLIGEGFKIWLAEVLPMACVVLPLYAGVFLFGGLATTLKRGSPEQLALFAVAGLCVLTAILAVLLLVYSLPAIEMEYIDSGSIGAGLRFKKVWKRITADPLDYLIFFLFHYLIQQVLSGLGVVLCFVGVYASAPWAMYTDGVLFGRYLAKKDAKAAEERPAP